MALSKDDLLARLTEYGIVAETLEHAASPTCDLHSEHMKGTPFERYIGKGQAKNLFFKVPSGGGALKGRLFLVCALVETNVDNKVLSTRLGIKPSSPLRLAADDIFDDVLQIPKGSVNPFVMAQPSCAGITLLLDSQFLACERVLFHPMRNDYTTALTPEQLTAFLDNAAPSRYAYVDFASGDPIKVAEVSAEPPKARTGPKSEDTPTAAAGVANRTQPALALTEGTLEVLQQSMATQELKYKLMAYRVHPSTSLAHVKV